MGESSREAVQRIEEELRSWLQQAITESYQRMYLAAARILRNVDGAQDAAQRAVLNATRFVLALAHLSEEERRAQLPAKPGAWLTRIAANAALDELRTQRRLRTLTRGPDDRNLAEQQPDREEAGPELRAQRREHRRLAVEVLPELLDRLPAQQSRTMWLIWESGDWPPDYDRVCGELGIKRNTARKRVHDALRNLGKLLRASGVNLGGQS